MMTFIYPVSDKSWQERLKRAVIYSLALGPRFFKWKVLSLYEQNALLFPQLLIALITRSTVNVCAISIGFLLVCLVTNHVSLEEVCPPNFEVLNYWLIMAASCLDEENEITFKVIASFSAVRFALPSIRLIVLHSLVRSIVWSMVSTKSLSFVSFVHAVLDVFIQSWLFRWSGVSFGYVVSPGHHVQNICWYRFLMESVVSSRDVMRCCLE